jgi:hypothetical protein
MTMMSIGQDKKLKEIVASKKSVEAKCRAIDQMVYEYCQDFCEIIARYQEMDRDSYEVYDFNNRADRTHVVNELRDNNYIITEQFKNKMDLQDYRELVEEADAADQPRNKRTIHLGNVISIKKNKRDDFFTAMSKLVGA